MVRAATVLFLLGFSFPVGATPADRVLELARRLQVDAERYGELKDKRAVFAAVHVQSLLAVWEVVAEPGLLENPEPMAEMAEDFVRYYRRSMVPIDRYLSAHDLWGKRLGRAGRDEFRRAMAEEREETGLPARPWEDAFLATQGSHSLVLEDAMLPIVAHIEHDLSKIAGRLMIEASARSAEERAAFGRDLPKINVAMERAVPGVCDRLGRSVPRFRLVDMAALRLDQWIGTRQILSIRAAAIRYAGQIEAGEDIDAELDAVAARKESRMRSYRIPLLRGLGLGVRLMLPERRRWELLTEPDPRLGIPD